ncbi:MAG TPA: hypothetical protein DEA47_01115 [Peptococcaceae bacterium]|nr:MAG: Uncharacterized protein XD50_0266 [Clostridia bacterium 41_269]HBT19964.1 hypothetical protein [Peptococcaceae bacterium]
MEQLLKVKTEDKIIEDRIKKILVQKIKDKALELGRIPKQTDFSNHQRFYAAFGSWNKALKAAGFPVKKECRRLKYRYIYGQEYVPSKEECIEALRRLSGKLGKCRPTFQDIESSAGIESGCPKYRIIKRTFGSLEKALEEAGLKDLPTKKQKEAAEKKKKLDAFFEGKKFVFDCEVKDKKLRFEAKKRKIAVVKAPKNKKLLTVLNWMRGVEDRGVLPSPEEIRLAVGEKKFKMLSAYRSGRSLAEIGKDIGLSKEGVRQNLLKGAEKAVRKFSKKY